MKSVSGGVLGAVRCQLRDNAFFLCLFATLAALVPNLLAWLWVQWSGFVSGFDLPAHWTPVVTLTGAVFVAGNVSFLGTSSLYAVVDYCRWPRFVYRRKVQPKADSAHSADIPEALLVVFLNGFFYGLAFMMALSWVAVKLGVDLSVDHFPSMLESLLHLIAFPFFTEFWFYYVHRAFHWKPLYQAIHKKHHKFISPMAFTAIYCHPLEHTLCNIMSVLLGPMLLGSHGILWCCWVFLALYNTCNAHGGYSIPFAPSPLEHDYHHFSFDHSFGVLGILDSLHNTDKGVEEYKEAFAKRMKEQDEEGVVGAQRNKPEARKQD